MSPVCSAFDVVQLLILNSVDSFAAAEKLICLFAARLQRKVWHQGRETRSVIQKPNCLRNADLKERFSQTTHSFGCVIHCLCK